ncbi:cupin domain-containing protein [Paracraurococcus lichenis]|uniref:Cupin domain-containing protein n=1 Tax=Paracraurococcus lichenis TaxID=3064888 RepID=A0ABT9DSK1_9PROT|nr:cupin domain-containing protein [Paracraurococcus sp. LOR1-02]MDO9706879.1 cupin domain-containing protein [Paracraurococcus sp. LOR1-02]
MSEAPEQLFLADDGTIPNNPRLPALVFRGAVPAGDPAAAEALFARHGWPPAWRDGIYPYHHYHPDAHEALAIARGQVRVMLGGEGGQVLELAAGDVAVLPAGTGHRNLGASPDLLVVGAYPEGQSPTEYRGRPGEHARAVPQITQVPDPPNEPVRGRAWPL